MTRGRHALFGLLVLGCACRFDVRGVGTRDDTPRDTGLHFDDAAANDGTVDDRAAEVALDLDASVQQPDAGHDVQSPVTPLSSDDGRLWLGLAPAAADNLALLNWQATGQLWNAEPRRPRPLRGLVYWAIYELASARDFEAAALVTDDNNATTLHLARRASGDWSVFSAQVIGDTETIAMRGFDLALGELTGTPLVVYSNGTTSPQFLTLETGAWSSPQSVPIRNDDGDPITSGEVLWVELVARTGSDEIALLYADDRADLGAVIWKGTSWDNTATARRLESNLKTNDSSVRSRAFDAAYESKSGDLLVAWGTWSNGFRYQTFDHDGGWADDSEGIEIYPGFTEFVDLDNDPASDRIAAVFVDLGGGVERLGLGTWNGDGWQTTGEYDRPRRFNDSEPGDFPAAVRWVAQSGEAVCVYADNEEQRLDWYYWDGSGGWVEGAETAIPGKGFTESVVLASMQQQARLLAVVSDSNDKLYHALYDGIQRSWTVEATPLSEQVARRDTLPFALALKP